MNCRACPTPEFAEKARKSALCFLKNPGKLPEESSRMAVQCLECASEMLAKDASAKREKNNRR